jgi:hypothetical protein
MTCAKECDLCGGTGLATMCGVRVRCAGMGAKWPDLADMHREANRQSIRARVLDAAGYGRLRMADAIQADPGAFVARMPRRFMRVRHWVRHLRQIGAEKIADAEKVRAGLL